MTITVKLSIHVELENGEGKSVQSQIKADSFEKDLKQLCQQVIEVTGQQVLAGYEAELKAGQCQGGVSIRTEARRYQFQGFSLEYRRRSYRMPDGSVMTPLDELLGFEKYQRRSWKAKEQICALAASISYRKAMQINAYINQNKVSASTICRVVREVGHRIGAQEAQFEAEKAGKVKAPVLCCEADGVWISLQKAEKRKAEIRVAIAYTGKKYISKDRKKLLNKVWLTGLEVSSQEWQRRIREKLDANFDLQNSQRILIGGDGSEWVGSSFDLVGIKQERRVLDPFHVKRAIRLAFGNVLDTKKVIALLYDQGFDAVEKILLEATVGATKAEVKARLNCLQYLRNHAKEIIPNTSLGAIESNVDKLIAQRMKTRGVSWSVAGAKAMLSLLAHQEELYENSFHYQTRQKQALGYQKKRIKTNEATVHTASFPVLRSGKMSAPYAKLFKTIINDDLPLSS
jgi:hypothetical protein